MLCYRGGIKNGKLDDSGTDAFWQLFTDGKYFELVNCNEMSLIDPKIYTSFDKLNGNFIRLSDFLKFSVFVGKEFKRTKPIKYENGWEDNSYCRKYDDTKYIVLYATRDLFLIKYESRYKDEYALITSKYTLDEIMSFLDRYMRNTGIQKEYILRFLHRLLQ